VEGQSIAAALLKAKTNNNNSNIVAGGVAAAIHTGRRRFFTAAITILAISRNQRNGMLWDRFVRAKVSEQQQQRRSLGVRT